MPLDKKTKAAIANILGDKIARYKTTFSARETTDNFAFIREEPVTMCSTSIEREQRHQEK